MPEMKVIKEKYKDNPQNQQVATMELYKKHKVNPLSRMPADAAHDPLLLRFFVRMLRSTTRSCGLRPFLLGA